MTCPTPASSRQGPGSRGDQHPLPRPADRRDRLVLAARFETYLTWRHAGDPAPRSARETAERIGWQAHTVAKRCENIRDRYVRLGVPGLRGPRALEELALLLVSTGELTAADLRRLPANAPPGRSPASPGISSGDRVRQMAAPCPPMRGPDVMTTGHPLEGRRGRSRKPLPYVS